MSIEDKIEEYVNGLETLQILEHDGDEGEADDLNCRLADLAKEIEAEAPEITALCAFPDNVSRPMHGKLVCIKGDKVYFHTPIGNVEGEASTMELV